MEETPPLNSEEIAEAIEEVSSDAVEIAQIEADRDIALAAIHSETETARIEVEKEHIEAIREETEEEKWQNERLVKLEAEVTELKAILQTQLTPPQPLEEIALETAEEVTEALSETPLETSSILPSTSPPISEIQTEVSVENEEGEQVKIEATGRRKYRPI